MRHKRRRTSTGKDSSAVTLAKLHPNIICRLCRGYIVDCITIVECMHSFCKPCIVKYLNDQAEHFECPKCGQLIHESNPWNFLTPDSALQTIIYKLVPGLQESELKQCADFYQVRGISPPRKEHDELLDYHTSNGNRSTSKKTAELYKKNGAETHSEPTNNDFHRLDEQISIHLLSCQLPQRINDSEDDVAQIAADDKSIRPFLRISCYATVNHLRKYLAYRLLGDIDKYGNFELFCEGQPLFKEHTLKFIAATVWGRFIDHSEESFELVMPIVYQSKSTVCDTFNDDEEDEDGIDKVTFTSTTSVSGNSVMSPH